MKDTLVIVFIAETDPEAVYQVKTDTWTCLSGKTYHESVYYVKQIMNLLIRLKNLEFAYQVKTDPEIFYR